jgi:hypothetical protein
MKKLKVSENKYECQVYGNKRLFPKIIMIILLA